MTWTKVADVAKDVTTYVIQRLQEDAEYMFRVYAQNPVGLSEPVESPPVTPRTTFGKFTSANNPKYSGN